jgi:hypothetical protein
MFISVIEEHHFSIATNACGLPAHFEELTLSTLVLAAQRKSPLEFV